MKNPVYSCSNCGYKSPTTQGLIQGKGGCTSCGKSNFKCPRCGIYMKIRQGLVSKPPVGTVDGQETSVKVTGGGDELDARAAISKIEQNKFELFRRTGEIINPQTGRAYDLGRSKKIRRIK